MVHIAHAARCSIWVRFPAIVRCHVQQASSSSPGTTCFSARQPVIVGRLNGIRSASPTPAPRSVPSASSSLPRQNALIESVADSNDEQSISSCKAIQRSPPSIQWGLSPDVEAQAAAFFFKNFVLPPRLKARGYLDLIIPFYAQGSPSSALHLATDAVALAIFGSFSSGNDVPTKAATKYCRALNRISQDVKDPETAKSDETLMSVLLAVLFEVSRSPPRPWSADAGRISVLTLN